MQKRLYEKSRYCWKRGHFPCRFKVSYRVDYHFDKIILKTRIYVAHHPEITPCQKSEFTTFGKSFLQKLLPSGTIHYCTQTCFIKSQVSGSRKNRSYCFISKKIKCNRQRNVSVKVHAVMSFSFFLQTLVSLLSLPAHQTFCFSDADVTLRFSAHCCCCFTLHQEIHELKDQIQDVELKYTQNLKEAKVSAWDPHRQNPQLQTHYLLISLVFLTYWLFSTCYS